MAGLLARVLGTDILLPNVRRVRGARAEHRMAAQSFPSAPKAREALSNPSGERVSSRSTADHSVSPPLVRIPRDYNAVERTLAAGRAAKLAYVDDAGQYTFGELAERVDRFGSGLQAMGLEM